MSLRIRLRRVGRKKQPSYRLVVTDSAVRRDGPYIDDIGFYNPRTRPAELRLDLAKVETWVGKGATLSDTAASLVRKARKGGDQKVGYKVPGAEVVAPAAEAKPKRAPRKKPGTPAVEATAASEPEVAPAAEAEAPAAEAEAPAAAEAPAEEAQA